MVSAVQLARILPALVLSCPAIALDASLQDEQQSSEDRLRARASRARRILYSASEDKLVINASPDFDPGVHDYTHKFGDAIKSHKGLKMSNAFYMPNDDPPTPYDGEGITTWDDAHPAPDPLGDYRAWWNPRDGIPRHPVLIIEDMEIGYAKYVDYVSIIWRMPMRSKTCAMSGAAQLHQNSRQISRVRRSNYLDKLGAAR